MNGRNINGEQLHAWPEHSEEDYFQSIDKEMNQAKKNEKKGIARGKIEDMQEQKLLDDLVYDVTKDSDSLN